VHTGTGHLNVYKEQKFDLLLLLFLF